MKPNLINVSHVLLGNNPSSLIFYSYYCDIEGADTYLKYQCPLGKYCSVGGNTIPENCPATKYRNTDIPATALSDCLDCPGGFYCEEATIVPIACEEGYYCPDNSEAQIICPGG